MSRLIDCMVKRLGREGKVSLISGQMPFWVEFSQRPFGLGLENSLLCTAGHVNAPVIRIFVSCLGEYMRFSR